jgi:2-phosphoglycerate kinase
MSDRLTLTRALESSGMTGSAAERVATEIFDAIHDNVATKADLRELEQRLRGEIQAAKADFLRVMNTHTGAIIAAMAALLALFQFALHR